MTSKKEREAAEAAEDRAEERADEKRERAAEDRAAVKAAEVKTPTPEPVPVVEVDAPPVHSQVAEDTVLAHATTGPDTLTIVSVSHKGERLLAIAGVTYEFTGHDAEGRRIYRCHDRA
jgi:hypothetical protein